MSAPFRIRRRDVGVMKADRGSGEGVKDYLERLMKMIPGEVVGLYLIGSSPIPEGQRVVLLIWSVVCLVGVVIVRAFGTADPEKNQPLQRGSVLISSVAFVIWLYVLGGVFKLYGLHLPYIGTLLMLVWTFFVPYFYKGTPD
ncbi:hypothetical protein ACFL6S_25095 [Candidatus Poribacteria bacterium]